MYLKLIFTIYIYIIYPFYYMSSILLKNKFEIVKINNNQNKGATYDLYDS